MNCEVLRYRLESALMKDAIRATTSEIAFSEDLDRGTNIYLQRLGHPPKAFVVGPRIREHVRGNLEIGSVTPGDYVALRTRTRSARPWFLGLTSYPWYNYRIRF